MAQVEREEKRFDEEIESLSQDISRVVRRADPEAREELLDYAAELIREDSEGAVPPLAPRPSRRGSLIGVCALLFVTGLLFLVLVPPVGTVVLLCAIAFLAVALLRGAFLVGADQVHRFARRARQD